jgi:hypothetical protein
VWEKKPNEINIHEYSLSFFINKDGWVDIKEWKFQTFEQVMHKKRELIGRLNGIQRRIQDGFNNGGLGRMEFRLQHELNTILRQEELMWYQRS